MGANQEIKAKIKEHREAAENAKSEEKLEDELGEGVEQVPKEPEKPDENFAFLDLKNANSVKDVIEELKGLPDIKDVKEQMDKMDAYEQYARQVWKVKMSDLDVFPIKLREIEKVEKKKRGDTTIEYLIWKKDKDGQLVTTTKNFRFNSATIQDKDEISWLASEKDVKHYAVIEEGVRINRMIHDKDTKDDDFKKYARERKYQTIMDEWQMSIQDYWTTVFKLYYNASDDDIKRMHFDDIVNYGEIALYKGGVKSPKYAGS